MDKKKIAAIYELSADKVNKILLAAGLDHQASDFSPTDMQHFDQAWKLIVEQGMSNTDARKELKKRAEQDDAKAKGGTSLDESFKAKMNEFLDGIADEFAGETPEFIEQQKELARQYMINRFWSRLGELAQSGEMQRNFDRVMGAKEGAVIEATVLPGESPALPENSSSVT